MKKMLLTIAIALGSSMFIGCGSSSDNGGTKTMSSLKSDISKLPSEPGQIQHNNASNASNVKNKMQQKIRKAKKERQSMEKGEDIKSCGKNGTIETIWYSDALDFVFNECIDEKTYQNGTYTYYFENENGFSTSLFSNFTYIEDIEDNPSSKITMRKLELTDNYSNKENNVNREISYMDGDMTSHLNGEKVEYNEYMNFVFLEDKNSKSFYVNGTTKIVSKCYSSTDTYTMDDKDASTWLVDHDTNENYLKSGTITINGLKYVFHDEDVTLSKDGKTETITQDEMIEVMEGSSTENGCSVSKAIKNNSLNPE